MALEDCPDNPQAVERQNAARVHAPHGPHLWAAKRQPTPPASPKCLRGHLAISHTWKFWFHWASLLPFPMLPLQLKSLCLVSSNRPIGRGHLSTIPWTLTPSQTHPPARFQVAWSWYRQSKILKYLFKSASTKVREKEAGGNPHWATTTLWREKSLLCIQSNRLESWCLSRGNVGWSTHHCS